MSFVRSFFFSNSLTNSSFSAALLGLPRLLNGGDIHAEHPADVDDENVSEQGFQSTLPGEPTRISSALALFRLSRILSNVLDENYPATSPHELSLQKISGLNDELDSWLGSLSPHLRLHFVQDKPSTNVVGSRSPLLVSLPAPILFNANAHSQSLGYYYVRTLIHRPAVGSSLGDKASSSVVALAQSSKHIIQIVQLLEERRMSFSICLNKNEVLLLAGFGLLFQGLNLDRKGKLIQDSQRLLCSVVEILERNGASGAAEFKKVACAMISIERFSKSARTLDEPSSRQNSDGNMLAPKNVSKPGRKLQAIASHFSANNGPSIKHENSAGRRSTAPNLSTGDIPFYDRSNSQTSLSSVMSDPLAAQLSKRMSTSSSPLQTECLQPPNLDYLSFSNDATPSIAHNAPDSDRTVKQFDHNGLANNGFGQEPQPPMDGIYPSADLFSAYITPSPSANVDWCSDIWNMTSEMGHPPAQSRVSFSEEELTSGEELSNCELSGDLQNMTVPAVDGLVGLEGLDGNFGI